MRIIKVLIAGAISLGLAYWMWWGVQADAFVIPWPDAGIASGKLHLHGKAWICFMLALAFGVALSFRTAWRAGHSAVGRALIEEMDWILGLLILAAFGASIYFGLNR